MPHAAAGWVWFVLPKCSTGDQIGFVFPSWVRSAKMLEPGDCVGLGSFCQNAARRRANRAGGATRFTYQTANATPPGTSAFGRRASPFPLFPLPRRRGKWSAGRRLGCMRAPRRTITRPAARRGDGAHPNDAGGAAPPGAPPNLAHLEESPPETASRSEDGDS